MTSGELLNKRFEKSHVGGGYKPADVEAFLAEAATAFTKLTRENGELKRQVEALRAQTADIETEKNSLRDALLNAQKFADSLVAQAREKAEAILTEARGKADAVVNGAQAQIGQQHEEYARIKTEVTSFRSRLLDLYREHLELIGAIPADVPETQRQADKPAAVSAAADRPEKPAAETTAKPAETAARHEAAPAAQTAAPVPQPKEEQPAVPAAQPEQPAVAGAAAQQAAAAQQPRVQLKMRYDPATGEYLPIEQG